jgi:hypothetical protein
VAPIDEADTKQLQKEFPNADLSKVSKISYHFTLNGLKCHADRVGQYLSQFLGKPGFDFSAYVKPNGGPRVWTMVNNFKPTRSDGCGTVRMEPLTHKDDMSMHLVHYSEESDLDSATDITPAQIVEAVPNRNRPAQNAAYSGTTSSAMHVTRAAMVAFPNSSA